MARHTKMHQTVMRSFFAKDLGTIAFQTSKKTISRAAKKDCCVPKNSSRSVEKCT
jgi:hypothetical protein